MANELVPAESGVRTRVIHGLASGSTESSGLANRTEAIFQSSQMSQSFHLPDDPHSRILKPSKLSLDS